MKYISESEFTELLGLDFRCESLHLNNIKNKDELIISDISEGTYSFVFTAETLNKSLTQSVNVQSDKTQKYMVDFIEGRVIHLTIQKDILHMEKEKNKTKIDKNAEKAIEHIEKARISIEKGNWDSAELSLSQSRKIGLENKDILSQIKRLEEELRSKRKKEQEDFEKKERNQIWQQRLRRSYYLARPGGNTWFSLILSITFIATGVMLLNKAFPSVKAQDNNSSFNTKRGTRIGGYFIVMLTSVSFLKGLHDGWVWICFAPLLGIFYSGAYFVSINRKIQDNKTAENKTEQKSYGLLNVLGFHSTIPTWIAGNMIAIGFLCLFRADMISILGAISSIIIICNEFSEKHPIINRLAIVFLKTPNRLVSVIVVITVILWIVITGFLSIISSGLLFASSIILWKKQTQEIKQSGTNSILNKNRINNTPDIKSFNVRIAIALVTLAFSFFHYCWPGRFF